jgi:acetyl-CoA carboxylase biotin carboxylase subunit
MRRAVGEYVIAGIKTTLPFFSWLLVQREFVDGAFHTAYLDEILAGRNGRPFVEPTTDAEDTAVIAAALQTVLSAPRNGERDRVGDAHGQGLWKARARAEALRTL